MKKSSTSVRTASWQYDSADYAEGMDNSNHPSYKQLKKYSGNQHGGAAEGNFGRGPVRGNDGTSKEGPKKLPTSALPANVKIKNPDYINGGAQVRTPGGTRAFDPSATQNYKGNPDMINSGRGPTKGNAQ
jgi:hypothetical protein